MSPNESRLESVTGSAPASSKDRRPSSPKLSFPKLRVTVLGSGTSTGVPMIGCDCAVCTSNEPKNQRMRSGLTLEWLDEAGQDRRLVVDTSPDFRTQCLRFGIRQIHGVLYTHPHADHIFGLDDLRAFNFIQDADIDCYGSAETLGVLAQTFPYAFDGLPPEGGGKPRLRFTAVEDPFRIFDLDVEPVPVWHGSMEVYGYRFGPFAYVTDTHEIPETSLARLKGVEVLILDALRYRPHATHFSIEEAMEMAAQIGARQTYFTHLNHEVDYNNQEVALPPGVELAYDGLSFTV